MLQLLQHINKTENDFQCKTARKALSYEYNTDTSFNYDNISIKVMKKPEDFSGVLGFISFLLLFQIEIRIRDGLRIMMGFTTLITFTYLQEQLCRL